MGQQDNIAREWLQGLIRNTGLTPTQIARKSGVNPSTLTRFLQVKGGTQSLRWSTIEAIAQAFDLELPPNSAATTEPHENKDVDFVTFIRSSPLMGVELELAPRETSERPVDL